eukprot:CAMPEP_0117427618 /NCGR_PEP_ID=MMETSP0758-20121206/7446_1 /TAXON_ID=63605 /ORGANISM="Percolomonas cosmopolitus, Strain AE-1 (ATCC 50343)" /LENGTH=1027 /DNA_ID=CAMNT_0005213395 /DNA_START=5852 /DNA_END=8935 /DNA_ORIENTATION=+
MTYIWTQISGTPIVLSDRTSSKLFIPKYTFPPTSGTYKFQVNVTNVDGYSSSTEVTIIITRSLIVSNIDGGNRRLPRKYPIYLDGTKSYDPDNDVLSIQTYSWSCTTCGFLFQINEPTQTIPANTLPVGTHTIRLLYRVGDRSDDDTVTITVFEDTSTTPSIRVKKHLTINENEPLLLHATLENYNSQDFSPQWTIEGQQAPINELTGLAESMPTLSFSPVTMITRTRSSNRLSLALKGGILYPGASYTFRVSLSPTIYAETTVSVNPTPKFGTIQLTPTTGNVFETTFNVIAPEWVDDNPNIPLQYAFILYKNSGSSTPLVFIQDYSLSNSAQFRVPVSGTHTLCVKVRDNFNATTTQCTPITINPPATAIDKSYLNTLVTSSGSLSDIKMVSSFIQQNPSANDTDFKSMKLNILQKTLDSIDDSTNPTELISIVHDVVNDTSSTDSSSSELASSILERYYCQHYDPSNVYLDQKLFSETLDVFNNLMGLRVHSIVDVLTDDLFKQVNAESSIQNMTKWHTRVLSCFAHAISQQLVNGETEKSYSSEYYDITVYKDLVKEYRVDAPSMTFGSANSRLQVSSQITTKDLTSDLEPLTLVNIRYKFTSHYNESLLPGLVSEVYFINDQGVHQRVVDLPTPNTLNLYLPSWNSTNAFEQHLGLQLKCVYFNETSQEWATDGCSLPEVHGTDSVTCQCTHTTLFGLANLPTSGNLHETSFLLSESFYWILLTIMSSGTAFIICNVLLCLCCCLIYQCRRRHRKKKSKHQTSLVVKKYRGNLFSRKKDYEQKYSSGLSNFENFLSDNQVQSDQMSPLELKNIELDYQHEKMKQLHKQIEDLLEDKQRLNKKILENDKLLQLNRSISRKRSRLQTDTEELSSSYDAKQSDKAIKKGLLADYEQYRQALRDQQALQEKIKREEKNHLRRENLLNTRQQRVTEQKTHAKDDYQKLTSAQDACISLRKKKAELEEFLRITEAATNEVQKRALASKPATSTPKVSDEDIQALKDKVQRYKRIAVALKHRHDKKKQQ